MVELEVLSGKTAGAKWVARRFPVRIGRSTAADLRIEEAGVWDDHVHIALGPHTGFMAEAQPNALVLVNGQPMQEAPLRNGDEISLGGAKLRFWLGEATQRESVLNEIFLWTLIASVCVAQIALVYWLGRF